MASAINEAHPERAVIVGGRHPVNITTNDVPWFPENTDIAQHRFHPLHRGQQPALDSTRIVDAIHNHFMGDGQFFGPSGIDLNHVVQNIGVVQDAKVSTVAIDHNAALIQTDAHFNQLAAQI